MGSEAVELGDTEESVLSPPPVRKGSKPQLTPIIAVRLSVCLRPASVRQALFALGKRLFVLVREVTGSGCWNDRRH
jgi:hypothetical protein